MATLMSSEQDQSDFDLLPEYVREGSARARESIEAASSKASSDSEKGTKIGSGSDAHLVESPETDVLEALWPGVHHHDLIHSGKRPPSFYLTIGFMCGAILSLLGIWIFNLVTGFLAGWGKPAPMSINGSKSVTASGTQATSTGFPSLIVPVASVYEVQNGDTLADIALRNYKRISPRLLDEICRTNNLNNADVLKLGQKLNLPVYRPLIVHSAQTAASPSVVR